MNRYNWGGGGTDGGDRRRIVVLGHGESYTTLGCKQHREILGVGDVIQLMRGMGEGGVWPYGEQSHELL